MPTRDENMAWLSNLLNTSAAEQMKIIIITLALFNLSTKTDAEIAAARAQLSAQLGIT